MPVATRAAGLFCVCLAIGVVAGCYAAPTPFPGQVQACFRFEMGIDSLAAPDANSKGKAYVLVSSMKDVPDDDLQFTEFAGYVERALAKRGYQRVESDPKADLLISMGYGLGNPQTTTKTYTTSAGVIYPVGWMWYTTAPTTESTQVSSYPITLVLEAHDLKSPGRQKPVWKTTVTSNSKVPNNVEGGIFLVQYYYIVDMRVQVPYMVAAASDYFATNTGRSVGMVIMGSDKRVFDVMGISPQRP